MSIVFYNRGDTTNCGNPGTAKKIPPETVWSGLAILIEEKSSWTLALAAEFKRASPSKGGISMNSMQFGGQTTQVSVVICSVEKNGNIQEFVS